MRGCQTQSGTPANYSPSLSSATYCHIVQCQDICGVVGIIFYVVLDFVMGLGMAC